MGANKLECYIKLSGSNRVGLTHKYWTRVEVTNIDKHSNLLTAVKKFCNAGKAC